MNKIIHVKSCTSEVLELDLPLTGSDPNFFFSNPNHLTTSQGMVTHVQMPVNDKLPEDAVVMVNVTNAGCNTHVNHFAGFINIV